MKNYKDFTKKYIGGSDIASLTVRSGSTVSALDFGQDDEYMAYVVDGATYSVGRQRRCEKTCYH